MNSINAPIYKNGYIICLLALLVFYSSCKKNKTPDKPEINYTKAAITNVSIVNVPFVNSAGLAWDSLDGPEFVFKVAEGSGFMMPNSRYTFIKQNVTASDLPVSEQVACSPFAISAQWMITLYELDSLSAYPGDEIGEFNFKPEDYKPTWPSKIQLQHPTISNLKLELSLRWQ